MGNPLSNLSMSMADPKAGVAAPTSGHTKPTNHTTNQIAALLSKVPVLGRATKSQCTALAEVVTQKVFDTGDIIVKQGDQADGFFILTEGQALVAQHDSTLDSKSEFDEILAQLEAGDHFGEAALLNNSKRIATVTATKPTTCLFLMRKDFLTLVQLNREVQFAARNAVSAEVMSNAASPARRRTLLKPPGAIVAKSPTLRAEILAAVSRNVLFKPLTPETMSRVIDEMWRQPVEAGTELIKQGDVGDHLYFLESGSFDVFITKDGKTRKIRTMQRGWVFGELALMYNAPRSAQVVAQTDGCCWLIDRYTFRRIVSEVSEEYLQGITDFLENVEVFRCLTKHERGKVAEALEELTYEEEEVVLTQGTPGDAMYILESGEVRTVKNGVHVATVQPGAFFGEQALLNDQPRLATCICSKPSRLLKLDRDAFQLLLGPLYDIMQRANGAYKSSDLIKRPASSPPSPREPTTIPFGNLEAKGDLGRGSFGFVQLVEDKTSGRQFALKAVLKQHIVNTQQQEHIMNEKRVMMKLDHPFLLRLFQTFKDDDFLYFLLEPCRGGELFRVLRKRGVFTEGTARFYAAQVVLAFEYMHKRNICYRDLKPENLLFSDDGYIKIADFGFAKELTGRTFTLCGTPDYIAPEIITGRGHGKGADWWTLGILIFEMLCGYAPFADRDPMKTYSKICLQKIEFPAHMSRDAQDLVMQLCTKKPTRRLGVVKGGAANIKQHKWFQNVNFDKLLAKSYKPPIIPVIKSQFKKVPKPEFIPYQHHDLNWDAHF